MPVRLLRAVNGQAANTTYFGLDDDLLKAQGAADDRLELASDYAPGLRIVTVAAANTSRTATMYNMNSSSAQTLTLNPSGYFPVNTVITVVQLGTGATTVVAGAGVTIIQGNGLTSLVTKGQNYLGQLIKINPTTWIAFGGFGG